METLGHILYTARTKKKVTASEAAKGTRIKVQHIEAMEQDDFSSVPAPAYAKGFIRIYSEYLGIDPAPLIKEYMEKHAPSQRAPLLPDEEQLGDDQPPERAPRKPFRMPALPKIPWDKIKRPKIPRPTFTLPTVPPRLLLLYSGLALLFLLLLVAVIRRERAPEREEVAPPAVSDPPRRVPAAPRPERALPMIDEVPEPYME